MASERPPGAWQRIQLATVGGGPVALTPAGVLIHGEARPDIVVRDLRTGVVTATVDVDEMPRCVAVSPDGDAIAVACAQTIHVVTLTGEHHRRFTGGAAALAWLPAGLAAARGAAVELLDPVSGQVLARLSLPGDLAPEVRALAADAGGTAWVADDGGRRESEMRGITSRGTGQVRGWRPGEWVAPVILEPGAPYPGFVAIAAADRVAAGTYTGLFYWDPSRPAPASSIDVEASAVAFLSPRLVIAGGAAGVAVCDLDAGVVVERLAYPVPAATGRSVAAAGDWIAAGGDDGLHLWCAGALPAWAGPPAGPAPVAPTSRRGSARSAADRDMVPIPGGTVLLGLSADEADRLAAELVQMEIVLAEEQSPVPGERLVDAAARLLERREWIDVAVPAHEVDLEPYQIDRHPVTVAQWRDYMRATGAAAPATWGRNPPPEDHFVTGVSWAEAAAYAHHHGLELPTEAEWERAARRDRAPFPWGWSYFPIGRIAFPRGSFGQSWAVGSRAQAASVYGVHDLIGEFGELCADRFQVYPGGDAEKFQRHFPGWREQRSVRGGFDIHQDSTCVGRGGITETERARDMKFRCVRRAGTAGSR